MQLRYVKLIWDQVHDVAGVYGDHASGAEGGKTGDAALVEAVRAIPPDGGVAYVVSLYFMVVDRPVCPPIFVEIGDHCARGGVGEEAHPVRVGEALALPVPVDVGVDVADGASVIAAHEEIESSVVVEVGTPSLDTALAGSIVRLSSLRPSGPSQ